MATAELIPPIDKSDWGDGPWQSEPDRVDFVHAGLPCLALRHPNHGYWCGYVAVSKPHPLYEVSASDADVYLDSGHRGLNYADHCSGYICHVPQPGMPDDVWWFGFDCGHLFDLAPGIDARLRHVAPELAATKFPEWLSDTYRDLPYVRKCIEELAEELAHKAGQQPQDSSEQQPHCPGAEHRDTVGHAGQAADADVQQGNERQEVQ